MKSIIALSALLLTSIASATDLPAPNAIVNPNYNNNTTIVSFTSGIQVLITYRGPSAFYKLSECAKPDSSTYRCDVIQESNVLLTAPDGSTAVVNLTVQDAWTLNRSGHNTWVHSQIILAGDVAT